MMQGGIVKRVARGKYVLTQKYNEAPASEKSIQKEENGFSKYRTFFENFSNFEKDLLRGTGCELQLCEHEKKILLEILSKENKYTPYTATELGKKCKLSSKYVIEHAKNLEKKGLISMKKEGVRWVFVPSEVTIKGLTEFFNNRKTLEKCDRTYSKKEKSVAKEQNTTNDKPVFKTFEEALSWQIHNAHRLILQFRVLRCNHEILKKTAWIFEKKAIQKHLPEAYIYMAKDVNSQIINVCPKKHFIFKTQFEFQDQLSNFINDLRKRLKDYDVILDLSEPVKICLEHRAFEDDPFAKKCVKKGLLYLKCKTTVFDSNGEPLEITVVIDKSRAIHLEMQGRENVDLYADNYTEFVEEIATGRIKTSDLRDLPEQNKQISRNIYQMSSTMGNFSNVMEGYGQHIQAHVGSIKELGESASVLSNTVTEQMNRFTEAVTEQTDKLTEAVEQLTKTVREKGTETEEEPIEEETVVYERGRAKIPISIYKHSNLRHKKSNNKTKTFKFKFSSGYWELKPIIRGRIRKTRIIYLPEQVEKGTKLKWWLKEKTICLKIQGGT